MDLTVRPSLKTYAGQAVAGARNVYQRAMRLAFSVYKENIQDVYVLQENSNNKNSTDQFSWWQQRVRVLCEFKSMCLFIQLELVCLTHKNLRTNKGM